MFKWELFFQSMAFLSTFYFEVSDKEDAPNAVFRDKQRPLQGETIAPSIFSKCDM
jgi:hypothetical protein